ncbi:MAG: ZPR1 zinc finger domain-containing protein [Nanoarchaeota archaeon]
MVLKSTEEFEPPDILEEQHCPICQAKTLTLTEAERDIPYFGNVYLYSMTCSSCKYHKADLESVEVREPCKWVIEVDSKEALNTRIVKSAEATIKIPHMVTIESGPTAQGYITNIEGLLMRVKGILESTKETADNPQDEKKARNLLKKLNRVLWGTEPLKIIIEDKTGNSAIISEKAEKSKLK